jgi:peptide/nickel transport system ATP-binding protein
MTAPTPIVELIAAGKSFAHRGPARAGWRLGGSRRTTLQAVQDVNLAIHPGEVVGLVGESGCGKSTLGRILAGILPLDQGRLLYHGRDIATLTVRDQRSFARNVQMVFQSPYTSLNPRMRIEDIISEAPLFHRLWAAKDADERVDDILRRVGLNPAYRRRYPHQFSGGERQRIGIGRALAMVPELVVCDEAVAALDVSIQAQILNLFEQLRREFKLAYLFISHDLGVVHHIADRIAVMYLGRIVEVAPAEQLFAAPNHPYSQALITQMPRLDRRQRQFAPLQGDMPSALDPPSGCHFHTRCAHAFARCRQERPQLREIGRARLSACHLNDAADAAPLLAAAGGATHPFTRERAMTMTTREP